MASASKWSLENQRLRIDERFTVAPLSPANYGKSRHDRGAGDRGKTLEKGKETEMTTTFEVKEMSCDNCAKHVTKAVKTVEPTAEVQVDLSTGKVDVTPSPKNPEALAKAITEAGYPAKVAA